MQGKAPFLDILSAWGYKHFCFYFGILRSEWPVGPLKNPGEAMPLFLAGKIKVTGNPMLALKFQKLFSLGAPGGQSIP